MNNDFENFCTKFSVADNTIYRSKYWTWSIRPLQTTIGSGILSLNRPAEHLSEITYDEGSDYAGMIKIVEKTLYNAFEYDKINYIMLMMVDNHVHYHVIPRYSRTIDFSKHKFKDIDWPRPANIGEGIEDSAINRSLREYLIQHIEQ